MLELTDALNENIEILFSKLLQLLVDSDFVV